jgi:hypothetical protein
MTSLRKYLSASERQRLNQLEAVVHEHVTHFVAVGKALMEIRDSRLYRQDAGTFEAYLKKNGGYLRRTLIASYPRPNLTM